VSVRPVSVAHEVGTVDGKIISLAVSPNNQLLCGVETDDVSVWAVDLRVTSPRPLFLRGLPWNTGPASVSPDAAKLAYAVSEGPSYEVYVTRLDNKETKRLFRMPYRVEQLSWSPDGGHIAVIGRSGNAQLGPSTLFLAGAANGSLQRLMAQFQSVYLSAWSRDGKSLFAATSSDGMDTIWELGLSDKGLRRVAQGSALELQPSEDGRFLYVRHTPFNLVRVPIDGGAEVQIAANVLRFTIGKDVIYIERQDSSPPTANGLNLYRLNVVTPVPQLVANIGFLPTSMQFSQSGLVYLERHAPQQEHIMVVQGWH
jgi:Tol biopolymer transport system component